MTFKKGESGCPGGKRNRIPPVTLKQIEESYCKWYKLIMSGKLDDETTLAALEKLVPFQWAYMYGKPAQSVDITSDNKPLAAVVNISLSDIDVTLNSRIPDNKLPPEAQAIDITDNKHSLPEKENSVCKKSEKD